MNRELPVSLHQRIEQLCSEGDSFAQAKRYPDAIVRFEQALAIVPSPKEDWEAATWIYGAIGDTHYLAGDFEPACQALTSVMLCPNGLGNPFLHLRLGESCYELGELDRAADNLARAYMGAGLEIFKDQDPKYLAFLRTRMQGI